MAPFSRRKHSKDIVLDKDSPHNESSNVTFFERIDHFTWAWFAFPLSTGGLSLLLDSTPHRFTGLTTIGKIFFIFAIVVTIAAITAITTRFVRNPSALRGSLTHPTEALFFPTFILNFANLIGASQVYGSPYCGPWFTSAMQALFWIYVAVAFVAAVMQYLYLFTAPPTRLTIQSMTPAWILPIFPSMLGGTLASIIAPNQSLENRFTIIIAGVAFQGLGWMVASLMYAVYLHRLVEYGLPAPNLRPGMFIAVGPPSFIGVALIGLSKALPTDYGYFARRPLAMEILQTTADFAAVFLWLFAFWFFCVALTALLSSVRKMSFHLVWWATIFPNIGFTDATISIGEQFESPAILWVSSAMTILLVALWIFVFVSLIRAVTMRHIMMPGKDEDKDNHKEDDEKHGVRSPA